MTMEGRLQLHERADANGGKDNRILYTRQLSACREMGLSGPTRKDYRVRTKGERAGLKHAAPGRTLVRMNRIIPGQTFKAITVNGDFFANYELLNAMLVGVDLDQLVYINRDQR